MVVQTNTVIPKGVTKINTNTLDNVGKVFTDLNKYLKNSRKYINEFNDSLDDVTTSMASFKNEYDKEHKSLEKELLKNLNKMADSFEENTKNFQTYLENANSNNEEFKNFISNTQNNDSSNIDNNNSDKIFDRLNGFVGDFGNTVSDIIPENLLGSMNNILSNFMPNDLMETFENAFDLENSAITDFINNNSNFINDINRNFSNLELPTFNIKDLVINSGKINDNLKILNSNFNNLNENVFNNDRYINGDNNSRTIEQRRDLIPSNNNRSLNQINDNSNLKEIQNRIKSETEKRTKIYLDNEYAEGNESKKIYNEYVKKLEKLKMDSLTAFGENFEQNEEYFNALENLKEDYRKKFKDAQTKMIENTFHEENLSNQLKYLDSKFAKGTNAIKKWNEYQDEIEKLKKQGLDVYGQDFEQNEEYQKTLANLNQQYADEMREARKADFKENHATLTSISDKIKETFDRNHDSLRGILGPLNLIFAPFEEFFGGTIGKLLGKGLKKFFGLFRKKKPTANDVAKTGEVGVGSLYVGNKIDELIDSQEGEGGGLFDALKDGLFGGLGNLLKGGGLGKALGGLGGSVLAGIGMIAGGLIWAAVDGIKGMLMSDEWGVSKMSGFLGGFLGGTSSGIEGAFSNMGKWALTGAGIGTLICPGIGTIAGGLLGAAIGGLLGAIGGEKIAKAFDDLKKWDEEVEKPIREKMFKRIFNTEEFEAIANDPNISGTEKVGKYIGTTVKTVIGFIPNVVKAGIEANKDRFTAWMGAKDFDTAMAKSFRLMRTEVPKNIDKTAHSFIDKWTEFGGGIIKSFNPDYDIEKAKKENKAIFDTYFLEPLRKILRSLGSSFDYFNAYLGRGQNLWELMSGGDKFKLSGKEYTQRQAFDAVSSVWDELVANNEVQDIDPILKGYLADLVTYNTGRRAEAVKVLQEKGVSATAIKTITDRGRGKLTGTENVSLSTNATSAQSAQAQAQAQAQASNDATKKQVLQKINDRAMFLRNKGLYSNIIPENGFTDLKTAKEKISGDDTFRNAMTLDTILTTSNEKTAYYNVQDAIIRPNGSIIKTDPRDTLVALKDITYSMNELKNNSNNNAMATISSIKLDDSLEQKLTDVISLLRKIAEKNLEIQLPQQTRRDLNAVMNGGIF